MAKRQRNPQVVKLRKIGSGLGVVIPKHIMIEKGWKIGDWLNFEFAGGQMLLSLGEES